MMMEQITNYVKPELIVVAIALGIAGNAMKKSQRVNDKNIPLLLGVGGIVLCAIWVLATTAIAGMQDVFMALFTSIVQGILVAGLSVYVDQIKKQMSK